MSKQTEMRAIHSVPENGGETSPNGKAPGETAAGRSPEAPPLTEETRGLSVAVQELKAQLTQLIEVNQSLKTDLDRARQKATEGAGEREKLIERIEQIKKHSVPMGEAKAEVEQLLRERETLTRKAGDLGQALSSSEQRGQELGQLLDKCRAERNHANSEAASLDSQLSRAMKVIEELRNALGGSQKREEELEARTELLEGQLSEAVNQRDTFKSELSESRNALEEVRKSILAASKESGQSFYED